MNYRNLFYMALLSFISMYVLMYVMVDSFSNVFVNVNQLYMAALMTVPMIVLELFLMRSMYTNKVINIFLYAMCLLLFVVLFLAIRKQTFITQAEFLKSMIPHHAAALLMCKSAHLQDPSLKRLCQTILTTQQAEIDFMKSRLKNLNT